MNPQQALSKCRSVLFTHSSWTYTNNASVRCISILLNFVRPCPSCLGYEPVLNVQPPMGGCETPCLIPSVLADEQSASHTFSYWDCNWHCYGNKPLLIHLLPHAHMRAVAEHVTCFLCPKKSIAVAMTSRLNISDAEWEITVSCSGLRVGCLIILLDISGFWPHSLLFSDAGKMMNNKRNTMICFVSVPLSTDTPCFRKANVCQTSFI